MARERYLLDDTEDTIHQNQIVLTTAKEKRANWWWYNKRIVLAVSFFVIVIGVSVFSALSQAKPDYTVAIMTEYTFPGELQEDVAAMLERYGEDLNGDGKVVVDVQHYHFLSNVNTEYEANELQAAYVRFAADASGGDCMLYFYDDIAYAYFEANDLGDYFAPAGALTEEYALWADVPGLNTLVVDAYASTGATTESALAVLGRLRVSIRAEDGVAFKKDSVKEYRQECIEMLDRLLRNEPTAEE